MGKTKSRTRYPGELRARAVQMVLDHESRSMAILSNSQKFGCSRDSLLICLKQHETATSKRDGVTIAARDCIKEFERENRQLRQIMRQPRMADLRNFYSAQDAERVGCAAYTSVGRTDFIAEA